MYCLTMEDRANYTMNTMLFDDLDQAQAAMLTFGNQDLIDDECEPLDDLEDSYSMDTHNTSYRITLVTDCRNTL